VSAVRAGVLTRRPVERRRRCAVAVLWLAVVFAPVAVHAQDKLPRSEAKPGGGAGVQIDFGALVRTLTGGPGDAAAAPVWPDAATAQERFSFPPGLARRAAPDGDPACEPGQLLVWWPDAQAAADGVQALRERLSLEPTLRAELPTLGGVLAMYTLADNEAALQLRTELRARYPSWIVDLNARASANAGPRLYALNQLQLHAGTGGVAVPAAAARVGVIDGPLSAQDDLALAAFRALSVLRPDEVPASPTHGNAVARLIAAQPLANGFAGAAPGVSLHWATVTRLVQGHERSNTLGQVLALDWLLGEAVHLVNVSMGGPGDAVLAAAYRKASARPVVVLAAAGNDGPALPPVYPAAYPGVLAVTAVDAALQVYAWANQGTPVALAAPGVDLWVPVGDAAAAAGQYVSGTSFATALATAVLAHWGEARLRQAHAERLVPICKAARELGAPGRDPVFGCGLVR
jgi:Subtilase family